MTRVGAAATLLSLALVGATSYAAAAVPPPAGRPGPATLGAATPGVWHTAAKLDRGDGPAVSCATTTACWAIAGGELLRSGDGGASWSHRTSGVPAEVDTLDDLDCPTAAVCFATARTEDLGHVVLVLRDDTITASAVPGSGRLWSISCRSSAACLTTDGTTTYVTRDGGTTWVARAQPLPTVGVPDLSCVAGSSTCWAVGHFGPRIARTTDFGVTWALQAPPSAVGTLLSIDCPTTSTCSAVGSRFSDPVVASTTDGGASWARLPLPPQSGELRSISCPTEDVCVATGSSFSRPIGFATSDGGASWGLLDLGTSGGRSVDVSCPTTTACAAVGNDGLGLVTTTGGTSWSPVELPVAVGAATELSCATPDRCVATTHDADSRPLALTTIDGGATWSRHPLPPGTGYVTSLDCVSTTTCFAWAYRVAPASPRTLGQSLRSLDGGRTWQLHQGPDTRGLATAELSCPTATTCLAAGVPGTVHGATPVLLTSDGGRTWVPRAAPDTGNLFDVACPTTTSCTLLARSRGPGGDPTLALTTVDLGATYEARDLPPAAFGYGGLDCVGTRCYAVGNDDDWRGVVAQSYNGGATWRAQPVPADAFHLVDVSCGSARSCAVTGSDGSQGGEGAQMMGTVDAGWSWTTYEVPWSGVSWPTAVACAASSCLSSDYSVTGTPRILAGSP